MDNEMEEEIQGSFRQWFRGNWSFVVSLVFLAIGITIVVARVTGHLE